MTLRHTPVLGLAGGVASGKSTVAAMFRELGAGVVDADRLGHEALRDEDVKAGLRERWGEEALTAEGEVDRARVAQMVFADEAARRFLNELVHPRIRQRIRRDIENLSREGARLIVLDAALLFEGGLESWCDAVAFVRAAKDERSKRAHRDRAWDAGEVARREAAQMDPEEKLRRSDEVIDNGGDLERTRSQVRDIYERMAAPAQSAG